MRVDHLIIGAGVTGCAVAWHLARAGREVLAVEAGTVAAGASGGPGKRGVRANGRDQRELSLMRRAYELWPDLAQAIGHDTGYERTGHLHLAERPEDDAALMAQVERQVAAGIPSELVSGERLGELEPDLAGGVRAAVLCPGDGVADHTATTTGFALAARAAGAEVRERTPVVGLRRAGDRVVVLAGETEIDGDSVVIAVNAGAADLLATIDVAPPVFTVFPQVVMTEPLRDPPVRHLIGHAHRRLALKSLPGGEVMVTGGWLGRWDEALGSGVVDDEQLRGNLAEAVAVYPRLESAEIGSAVADRAEAISHDMTPIIDVVPGAANAVFATGWSGHGWAIAPAVAEHLAEWVLTGERPAALAPFSLGRFG